MELRVLFTILEHFFEAGQELIEFNRQIVVVLDLTEVFLLVSGAIVKLHILFRTQLNFETIFAFVDFEINGLFDRNLICRLCAVWVQFQMHHDTFFQVQIEVNFRSVIDRV